MQMVQLVAAAGSSTRATTAQDNVERVKLLYCFSLKTLQEMSLKDALPKHLVHVQDCDSTIADSIQPDQKTGPDDDLFGGRSA